MSSRADPAGRRSLRLRLESAGRHIHWWKLSIQAAFARLLLRLSDRQLERSLGPMVIMAMPFVLRLQFRPEYAVDHDGADFDATILLTVLRDEGRLRDGFEVMIRDKHCRVRRSRADRRPDGRLTVALPDLLRMGVGAIDPHALASDGRIQVAGDTFLVFRFPAMFRQPTRSVIALSES